MKRSYRINKDLLVGAAFVAVIGILVLASIFAYHSIYHEPPYVDDEKYPIKGIDISSHNGVIDFMKVARSGIEFVYMKVSEGGDFNDSRFAINYEGAKRAGLKIGFYHFFRFDKDGISQAVNFVETIGKRNGELGLAIDVEKEGNPDSIPAETVVKRLIRMVDYLNLLGHRVTIYTNLDGYNEYIADNFPGYPLWICRFKENPIYTEWTFWQYSHSGKVPGIDGKVDLDVFCGNKKEWNSFLNGSVWPYES